MKQSTPDGICIISIKAAKVTKYRHFSHENVGAGAKVMFPYGNCHSIKIGLNPIFIKSL